MSRWMIVVLTAIATARAYELGDVHVRVVDEAGDPVAGAAVHCVGWYSGPRVTPLQPDEQGSTDADGRATFHNKFRGQSFIRVISGRFGGWFRVHETKDGASMGVFTIGLGRTVRGVVTDKRGNPLEGVLVSVDGCLPAAITDASGGYAIPNVGTGHGRSLGFYKAGYAWVDESPRPDMKSVDVALPKGADVAGTVVFEDGSPAAGAFISYSNRLDGLQTDESGRFTLYGVPAHSRLEVHAFAQRESTSESFAGSAQLEIIDAPPAAVTVQLVAQSTLPPPPPRTITGKVVHFETGKPVTARMFMGSSPNYAESNPGATDQNGEFVIDRGVHGTVWISAVPINPLLYVINGPVQVDTSEGSVDGVVLKAAQGCAIRGRVTREGGAPVPNRQLIVSPSNPFYPPVVTRDDGRFTIGNIETPDAPLRIMVDDGEGSVSTIEISPLKQAELRENVEIVLPAARPPRLLRGVVRDTNGLPIPNVSVMLTYDPHKPGVSVEWPVTDDDGRFVTQVRESGRMRISASTSVYVQRDGGRYDIQQHFKVLGDDTFEIDASKDSEIALVLALSGAGVMQGRVTDTAGGRITADVRIIKSDSEHDYGRCDAAGYFAFHRTPEPPFLLEFSADGYKARILSIDAVDTQSTPISVALERGPFSIGESVWTAVTGLPATEESVAALPLSSYVRKREPEYYRMAQRPVTPEVRLPQASPMHWPRLRLVDKHGNPVQRAYIVPLQGLHHPDYAAYLPLVPARSRYNELGIFEPTDGQLPYGVIIWAEGLGRVADFLEMTADPDAIRQIVLYPACSVDFTVLDPSGTPAASVPVLPAEYAWRNGGEEENNPQRLGLTDAAGRFSVNGIAPGVHLFAIGFADEIRRDRRLVSVLLTEGQTLPVTVTLRTDPEDMEWLLQTWRRQYFPINPPLPNEVVTAIAQLSDSKKAELVRAVRNALEAATKLSFGFRIQEREISLMAPLAAHLKDADSVSVLKTLLRSHRAGRNEGLPPQFTSMTAVARTLVELEGSDSLAYFEQVALDDAAPATSRMAAIEALGLLATQESAEAFSRIRDAARALPDAPAARAAYTHAERILETVQLVTLMVHGGLRDAQVLPDRASLAVIVSEDYATADAWTQTGGGSTHYALIRIGDEWLIRQFGGTIVP